MTGHPPEQENERMRTVVIGASSGLGRCIGIGLAKRGARVALLAPAAPLPDLSASAGKAIYLSSIAGQLTPPWPGLGAYAVSKAALGTLVDAWRAEHPGIGFTRLVVGDCAGGEGDSMTEFNA